MKLTLFAIFLFPLVSYAERAVNMSTANIDAFRIHTTNHANSSAHNIATIKMSGLEDGCTFGLFFDTKENQATMSIVLSAIMAKANVRIAYEPNIHPPWGDSRYCALTYFDIQ